MQKILFILSALMVTISCSQSKSPAEQPGSPVITDTPAKDKNQSSLSWQDSGVMEYVDRSENELTGSKKDTSVHIQWILDRMEKRNSVNYFVYRIGHDEKDENGEESRFVTEAWLYVDSASRSIYEYDVVNDSLEKWIK